MSWGRTWGRAWGASGAGFTTPYTVDQAYAPASNQVLVVMSKPVQFFSPLTPGDASDLRNWTLTLESTGAPVDIAAVQLGANTSTLIFTIFGDWPVMPQTYRITAANLIAADLTPLSDPKFALFTSLPIAQSADTTVLTDVYNAQSDPNTIGGALTVTQSGDYQLESGLVLLKKLITRRITTAEDEFYHLAGQGYGSGVPAKEFYTDADLVLLRSVIERQVLLEPEVESASVTLALGSDHVLTVSLKAKLRVTGQTLEFSTPLPSQGVTL